MLFDDFVLVSEAPETVLPKKPLWDRYLAVLKAAVEKEFADAPAERAAILQLQGALFAPEFLALLGRRKDSPFFTDAERAVTRALGEKILERTDAKVVLKEFSKVVSKASP